MSTPAAPHRSSPTSGQILGALVILVLLLVGIAQCGSAAGNSSTPDSVETSETATPTSEPPVADGPVNLPPAPAPYPGPEPYPYPEPEPVPVPYPEPEPVPEPAPAPDYSDDDSSSGSGSVYYKNCTAARAAGAAPLYAGDPGYASHLDRDGDGVACE